MQLKGPVRNITTLTVVLFLWGGPVAAQPEDSITHAGSNRILTVAAITGGAYAATTAFLYSAWYSDYPQSQFHFFNDSGEWLQMDKAGHFGSGYYLSRWNAALFRYAGMKSGKAALAGTLTAYGFLLGIEIMDGFSSEWGFSGSDIIANTGGAALFYGQEKLWKDQRITVKISVHKSRYADLRPDLLGETSAESIVKDYNGHTIWLSLNPASFSANSVFPRWLNIAAGLGADGMLGGLKNPKLYNGEVLPVTERYRQFYLAPDIDLTKIRSGSAVLNTLKEIFGFIKFPAPAIEYNTKGQWKLHGIYF